MREPLKSVAARFRWPGTQEQRCRLLRASHDRTGTCWRCHAWTTLTDARCSRCRYSPRARILLEARALRGRSPPGSTPGAHARERAKVNRT